MKVMIIVDQPNGRFIGVHKDATTGNTTRIVGPGLDGFDSAEEAREVAESLGFKPVDCEW